MIPESFKQIFDLSTGRLKSREDRYANKLSIIYSASGKISRVQDTLGRYIDFSYYTSGIGDGRLNTITDFASRTVTYEYAEAYSGGPVILTKVKYAYSGEAGHPFRRKPDTDSGGSRTASRA